ncbi:hypothetical protein VZT92_001113 [Zoarces viviparus]|uniref:Uncharacterized protein n=2 Tax=Zoarces viviparus TaxID=48416 RepID=A0AAW1GG21_ZOAVI
MAGAVAPSGDYSGILRAKLKKAVTDTGGRSAWKRDKVHWDNCMKRWTEEGWWKAVGPLPPSVNSLRFITKNLTKRLAQAQTAEKNQTKRCVFVNPLKQALKDREEEHQVAMMALGMAMTDRVQVDMPTGKEKTRLLDITPPTQALECPAKTAQELGEAPLASAPPAPSTGLYPVLPPTPPPYSSNNPFIQAPVRTVRGGLLTGGFQMALDKGCIIETASTPTERAVSGMMERVKKLERVIWHSSSTILHHPSPHHISRCNPHAHLSLCSELPSQPAGTRLDDSPQFEHMDEPRRCPCLVQPTS